MRRFKESYKLDHRGMDYQHDVHDWLGGYPYESATPQEIEKFMEAEGFSVDHVFSEKGWRLFGRNLGASGSGCDEYVCRRV